MCKCTYCIYYADLIHIYSYIKFHFDIHFSFFREVVTFLARGCQMIVFYRIPMEVGVVAPCLIGPPQTEGERLDAAESARSEGWRGLQMLGAR